MVLSVIKEKRKSKASNVQVGARIRAARRALDLTQEHVARECGVTVQAVQQWESGRTLPEGRRLKALSRGLRQSIEWILDGPVDGELERYFGGFVREPAAAYSLEPRLTPVPLIDYKKAVRMSSGTDPRKDAEGFEHASVPISQRGFAVRVRGDAMEPDLPAGVIAFIDPELTPEDGDFVFVAIDDSSEPVFKQYVHDGPLRYLRASNQRYEQLRMTDRMRVIGVVVEMRKQFRT